MPVHGGDACNPTEPRGIDLNHARMTLLTTPPPDELITPATILPGIGHRRMSNEDGDTSLAVSDNTAAGMSMRQEDTLYLGSHSVLDASIHLEKECTNMDATMEDGDAQEKLSSAQAGSCVAPTTPVSIDGGVDIQNERSAPLEVEVRLPSPTFGGRISAQLDSTCTSTNPITAAQTSRISHPPTPSISGRVDDQFDFSHQTRPWDCSNKRVEPKYPCSIFRPFARFAGNQQSDRQIYNVEVTVLTVDMEQATTSGYLQICGLTPDHPTLTTFFTGEIIGGPDQRYSFRTRDSDWGTNDKVDLTHWARFPAFRPLIAHAKKDLDFVYPPNQENWWQQDNIFMRWKEHFLVPDHKLKSIQGASFEGFYYICFNQVEGRISGIYYHSRSEKYQRLELRHEGLQGVWAKGVCPSVEFR